MKEHQVGTFVWWEGLVGYYLTEWMNDRVVVLHDFFEGAFLPGTTIPISIINPEADSILWILDPEEWEE